MLRPLVDYCWTSCRHLVCVSSLDQPVFVSVETFRAHSLFMMSQERNLSDPYIATLFENQLCCALAKQEPRVSLLVLRTLSLRDPQLT